VAFPLTRCVTMSASTLSHSDSAMAAASRNDTEVDLRNGDALAALFHEEAVFVHMGATMLGLLSFIRLLTRQQLQ
jgi:hypothetical protein